MDASVALTGLLMGLAGGPHCLAMCGPVCAAVGRPQAVAVIGLQGESPGSRLWSGLLAFQAGRLVAYAALGAVAAGSVQALGWLSVQSALVRPVWTFIHVGAAVLGGLLLWGGQQPAWLDEVARRIWSRVRALTGSAGASSGLRAAGVLGLGWAFMPCSLLYSALMVAALGHGMANGALTMALFAAGSGLSLLLGPWIWWRGASADSGRRAVRLAGAALLAVSLWALWRALVDDQAPWCLSRPGA
jgi:sulfite exporter TauE/SafE